MNNPLVYIKAITVSCGVTYIDAGVENVLRLLDYLDIENIIVAGGSSVPLETNHSFPQGWRQASTSFYGVSLPATQLLPSTINASELIVNTINEADSPITIIALGPLTNIANALLIDPTIKQKIDRIDIMGGAVNVLGNIGKVYPQIPNYVAEWNLYVDPHAADIVFSSIENIRLVPLDATNEVPITSEFKSKLQETKEADIANQLLTEGLFFWDELTAVALTNPEVLSLEMFHIDIIVDQENHEGQTVRNDSAPVNAEVAIGADPIMFASLFLGAINHETDLSSDTNGVSPGYSVYWGFFTLLVVFLYRRNQKH